MARVIDEVLYSRAGSDDGTSFFVEPSGVARLSTELEAVSDRLFKMELDVREAVARVDHPSAGAALQVLGDLGLRTAYLAATTGTITDRLDRPLSQVAEVPGIPGFDYLIEEPAKDQSRSSADESRPTFDAGFSGDSFMYGLGATRPGAISAVKDLQARYYPTHALTITKTLDRETIMSRPVGGGAPQGFIDVVFTPVPGATSQDVQGQLKAFLPDGVDYLALTGGGNNMIPGKSNGVFVGLATDAVFPRVLNIFGKPILEDMQEYVDGIPAAVTGPVRDMLRDGLETSPYVTYLLYPDALTPRRPDGSLTPFPRSPDWALDLPYGPGLPRRLVGESTVDTPDDVSGSLLFWHITPEREKLLFQGIDALGRAQQEGASAAVPGPEKNLIVVKPDFSDITLFDLSAPAHGLHGINFGLSGILDESLHPTDVGQDRFRDVILAEMVRAANPVLGPPTAPPPVPGVFLDPAATEGWLLPDPGESEGVGPIENFLRLGPVPDLLPPGELVVPEVPGDPAPAVDAPLGPRTDAGGGMDVDVGFNDLGPEPASIWSGVVPAFGGAADDVIAGFTDLELGAATLGWSEPGPDAWTPEFDMAGLWTPEFDMAGLWEPEFDMAGTTDFWSSDAGMSGVDGIYLT